jgi:hypothetical protein
MGANRANAAGEGMTQVNKNEIGLMSTAIIAGTIQEATPQRACAPEESCPEPEHQPTDMKERGRPLGPTGPGRTAYMTTGPTGPTGNAAILEGPDGASGSGNTTIVPGTGPVTLNLPTGVTFTQS